MASFLSGPWVDSMNQHQIQTPTISDIPLTPVETAAVGTTVRSAFDMFETPMKVVFAITGIAAISLVGYGIYRGAVSLADTIFAEKTIAAYAPGVNGNANKTTNAIIELQNGDRMNISGAGDMHLDLSSLDVKSITL